MTIKTYRRAALAATLAISALATGAGAQVPDEIYAELVKIGRVVAPAQTALLYRPLFGPDRLQGVAVVRDLAFGSDPKQILNVYKPQGGGAARAVLLFFPGGQGTKQMSGPEGEPFYDNVGAWGVRNGLVVVIAQYRTGGGQPWDAGARDVGAVIQWIRTNLGAHGGDPGRIVAMGQSNGGSQLANYLGHAEIQGPGGPGLRGAVVMGSAYNILPLRLKAAPVAAAAPALVDPREMLRRSNLEGLKAQRIPLLLIASELDPEDRVEIVQLMGDELRKAGGKPTTAVVPRHSHISQIVSFGTGDETMSAPVLAFIRSSAGR